jgi:hypothetical protein
MSQMTRIINSGAGDERYTRLQEVKHKTLSAYYPRICTLVDYLSHLTHQPIVIDTDHPEYKDLASSTLCAPPATYDAFPEHGDSHLSQQEAIDRVLSELGKQSRKPGEGLNMLLAGNRVN